MYNTELYQDILNIISEFAHIKLKLINYKQKTKNKKGYKTLQVKKKSLFKDISPIIHSNPLISLEELRYIYNETFETNISYSTIYRFIQKLKKKEIIMILYNYAYFNEIIIFCPCLALMY